MRVRPGQCHAASAGVQVFTIANDLRLAVTPPSPSNAQSIGDLLPPEVLDGVSSDLAAPVISAQLATSFDRRCESAEAANGLGVRDAD
jgi:hypothetical protein